MAGLDLLRGVAVLLVLGNHLRADIVPGLVAEDMVGWRAALYWAVVSVGWTGVDLFFVLSGFLVGGRLIDEMERRGRVRLGRFWGRRARKILPSYLFLLAILGGTGATGYLGDGGLVDKARELLPHLFFFQNYLASNPNGPTWSLAVEEHFYLLLPLVFLASGWVASRRGPAWPRILLGVAFVLCLVCTALRTRIAATEDPGTAFMWSHLRIDTLWVGVAAGVLARSPRFAPAPRWLAVPVLLAVAAALGLATVLPRTSPWMFSAGYPALALAFAGLVVLASRIPARRVDGPTARFVRWVGTISYNVYLWHYFLAALGLPGFALATSWVGALDADPLLRTIGQAAIFIAASIGVGAAATRWVERPGLRFAAPGPPSVGRGTVRWLHSALRGRCEALAVLRGGRPPAGTGPLV